MSVEIYDSSSEELSSDEYSHDEDDDDLMNAAVSGRVRDKTAPTKSTTSTLVTPTKRASGSFAPPRGREQTAKQINMLSKKKRLHLIYKNRSIKWFIDENKRNEQRNNLKHRIKLSTSAAEMEKLKVIEMQKVATAKQELENFMAQQRAVAAAAVATLKQQQQQQQPLAFSLQPQPLHEIMAQVQKELEQQQKFVQNLQCTPTKSPELVCLDDTENEESPDKPTLPETTEMLASLAPSPTKPEIVTQMTTTQLAIANMRGADYDVDVAVVQSEIIEPELGVCMPKVEPEIVIPTKIPVENNNCNELLKVSPIPEVENEVVGDTPLPLNIEEESIPMDLEIITNNVSLKQPTMAPMNLNQSPLLQKNPLQLQSLQAASVAPAAIPHASNIFIPLAPPSKPATEQQNTPVLSSMRAPIAISTSTPRQNPTVLHSSTTQNVQSPQPTTPLQATNFSIKRRRSPTPEKQPAPPPNNDKSSTEILISDTHQQEMQQPAKRPLLDPASNAAFYDKIKDLLPAYEEAISVQVKAAVTTDDKLNEKIKRIHADLNTLGGVLKTKEEEWNRLLYLKRVKEELLERLLRMKQVHKATKRCQSVKNYSIKQLQELEACLSEERPTEAAEKPTPNTETLGNHITQLLQNRANMRASDLMQEEEKLKAFRDYLLRKDTDASNLWCNNNDTDSEQRSKGLRDKNYDWQRSESLSANKNVTLPERDQAQRGALRATQSYSLPPRQTERPLRNAAVPPLNVDYSKHNSVTTAQVSNIQQPMSMGRQGPFKDVQSIIDDFRREHPDALPRVGKRLKPELYATQQNESNNYTHRGNLSIKDIPTLQKLLSGRACNNLQQHSYVAPMPKPPLYRPGYNASHELNTTAAYAEPVTRSYLPKRNMHHRLNNFEYYGRNDIALNGQVGGGSGVGVLPNKYKLRICQECHRCEAEFVCGGCTNQWYCSKECQLTAWDKHQQLCGV